MVSKEEMDALKIRITARRNELKDCPCCGSNIQDRKVALYKGMIDALYKIYIWCGKNDRHEFQMHEVRDFLGKNEYARLGDFTRFGGIVYRPKVEGKKKGHYGINMERAKEFFHGTRMIPVQITLNQITNEIIDQTDAYWYEFPSLVELMKEKGQYDHESQAIGMPIIPDKPEKKRAIIDPTTRTVRFE